MKWHDDGHAVAGRRRPRQRLLARRPDRGRRPPRRASSARCARRCWSPTTSSAATATPTTSRPTGSRCTPPCSPPCRRTAATSARPWDIAKIYWGAMSESRMRDGLRALRDAGDTTTFEGMDPDGPLPPFVTATTTSAPPIDATRTTSTTRWPRSPRTPPRSPPTGRSSRCPTTSAPRSGASSSTGWPRASRVRVGDDGLETDLFAGLGLRFARRRRCCSLAGRGRPALADRRGARALVGLPARGGGHRRRAAGAGRRLADPAAVRPRLGGRWSAW